ncbi:hypothetical protein C806_02935 [Lachnospiraceae bacterium 3-1]|nr:hypothetical protein C806_02935 [Lachnospiraceae bacterium 3-1]
MMYFRGNCAILYKTMGLDIWNERVSAVRQIFKFVRTVVK